MEILSLKSFSKVMTDHTFTDYYYRLMLLARSVFEWKNLPNGMNEKWIEKFLFRQGKCVFFKDAKRGFMIAEVQEDGNLNNYEETTTVTPTGVDIEPITLTPGEDCVLIRNNDECLPTSFSVKLFAYRLANISRTIDVNIDAQKTPKLMVGSNKNLLTLKNIYNKWEGFEPVIYIDKNMDTDQAAKCLDVSAPMVFPELQQQKQNIWDECLTFLGINNANTDKKERLITSEVEANNNHIDLSADVLLKSRQQAVDEINKLFGSEFECEIEVGMRERGKAECTQDIPSI